VTDQERIHRLEVVVEGLLQVIDRLQDDVVRAGFSKSPHNTTVLTESFSTWGSLPSCFEDGFGIAGAELEHRAGCGRCRQFSSGLASLQDDVIREAP
jgi:hypothetical protein